MSWNSSRRAATRGLVVLTAMAIPGVVPLMTADHGARADGPTDTGSARYYKPAKRPGQGQAKGRGKAKKVRPGQTQARISLTTGAPGVPVVPGRTYNWPFSVTNSGPIAAGPVLFSAPVPKSLEFVSGQQNCSYRPGNQGGMAVCEIGPMKPGQTQTGVLTAKVARNVRPHEAIASTAAVSWGRSRVSRAFPEVNVAETVDISVLKGGPARIRPGDVLPYEITIRNAGPSVARDVKLTDVVQAKGPIEVLGVRSPAGSVGSGVGCTQRGMSSTVCSVGELAVGEQRKVVVNVKAGPQIRPGTVIKAPATVTTATTELNLANNAANVLTRVRRVGPGIARPPVRDTRSAAGIGLSGAGSGQAGRPNTGTGSSQAQAGGGVTRGGGTLAPGGGNVTRGGGNVTRGGGDVPGQGRLELPRTGTEAGLMVDVGLGFLGIGLILYRLGRRRTEAAA